MSEFKIIENGDTGERMVLDNNVWAPIDSLKTIVNNDTGAKKILINNAWEDYIDSATIKDRTWGEVAGDSGAALAGGFANLGGDLAWLADKATLETFDFGAQKAADHASEYWSEAKSDQMKASVEKLGAADGFIDTLMTVAKNPELLPDTLIGSLPYMLPIGLAARGAKAAQLSGKAVAGITAGSEGILEGANAGREAEKSVSEMTAEQLFAESDRYRAMLSDGLTHEQAVESIRKRTGLTAFAVTMPLATLASVVSGSAKLEAEFFTGKGVGSVTGALAKEGVEEVIQEGSNALGGNVGKKIHLDSTQDLMEGVPEAAAMGLVAGTGQAAGMKAVGGAVSTVLPGEQDPEPETDEEMSGRLQDELKALDVDRQLAIEAGADQEEIEAIDQTINAVFAEFQSVGKEFVSEPVDELTGLQDPNEAPVEDSPVAEDPVNVERGTRKGIGGLIDIARKMGFEEEAIRLETAEKGYATYEALIEAGELEAADRLLKRANDIYQDVTGETGLLTEYADEFPAPYDYEGEAATEETDTALVEAGKGVAEYNPDENVVAVQDGQDGELTAPPDPGGLPAPQGKLEDSGIIFAEGVEVEDQELEDIPHANLSDINLTDDFETESGEIVQVTQTAEQAVTDIDEKINGLKELVHCLRG
jgi:hypothetical protein